LLLKAIHYGPACRQAGIEWFSCILSVVFLLPVLLFYLFLPHFALPGLLVPVVYFNQEVLHLSIEKYTT
jgi:hypothetical protein